MAIPATQMRPGRLAGVSGQNSATFPENSRLYDYPERKCLIDLPRALLPTGVSFHLVDCAGCAAERRSSPDFISSGAKP